MISVRGPNNIAVIGTTAAPVMDICHDVVFDHDLDMIRMKYNISRDEIVESLNWFISVMPVTREDDIELEVYTDGVDLAVDIVGTSDVIFVDIIRRGLEILGPDCDISEATAMSLSTILYGYFSQIAEGVDPEYTDITSEIVCKEFAKKYGEISQQTAIELSEYIQRTLDETFA